MENSKKNTILAILAIAAIILTLAVLFLTQNNKLPRDNDTEFKNGSKIQISFLSDTQTESLYKLCKVWGYTKYYHPSVISGDLNWDAELFRVMPKILKSKDFSETNRILFDWLDFSAFGICMNTIPHMSKSQRKTGMRFCSNPFRTLPQHRITAAMYLRSHR